MIDRYGLVASQTHLARDQARGLLVHGMMVAEMCYFLWASWIVKMERMAFIQDYRIAQAFGDYLLFTQNGQLATNIGITWEPVRLLGHPAI